MVGRAVLIFGAVAVFSVAGLSCDEVIRQKGAELVETEAAVAAAEDHNDKLSLEIASMTSPRYLSAVAEGELGMIPGDEGDRVFYVTEDIPPDGNEETDRDIISVLGELIF